MDSYKLTISNPAIKTPPPTSATAPITASALTNTAYVDQPGGNNIDLTIDNNSGVKLTFHAAPTDDLLLLQVSKKIMDETHASKLRALDSWSVTIPQPGDQDPASDNDYYNFYLAPSKDQSIEDRKSGLISLTDFEPSAKGSGNLQLRFTSNSQDPFTIYGQLNTCGLPQEGRPYLLSDGILKPYVYVNTNESTSVIVSELPVTDGNKVENIIQVRFVFQGDTEALIPTWDNAPTPTFHISFPYSHFATDASSAYDLTDCLAPGAEGYDPTTSARNIVGSIKRPAPLDPRSSANQNDQSTDPQSPPDHNDFWIIATIGGSNETGDLPGWDITPTSSNQHLFTALPAKGVVGDPGPEGKPGPELNIWLSHIYSGLPLSECDSTLIYLHWHDFPGFNDGVYVMPLTKELLTIRTFSMSIERNITGPELLMQWDTSSGYCNIIDNIHRDSTGTDKRQLSGSTPLQSTYVLRATASNAISTVCKTISIQWAINTGNINHDNLAAPMKIMATPDGKHLLILDQGNFNFRDPHSLGPQNIANITTDDTVFSTAISPDGFTLYYSSTDTLYRYDLQALQQASTSAGQWTGPGGCLGFSTNAAGGVDLIAGTDALGGPNDVTKFMMDPANLQVRSKNTTSLTGAPYMMAIGPKTGRIYVATEYSVTALEADLTEIPGSSCGLYFTGQIVPRSDEKFIYVLSVDTMTPRGVLTQHDGETFAVLKKIYTPIVWNPVLYMAFECRVSPLILSADGSQLFLAGINFDTFVNSGDIVPVFTVLDADTLEQPDWANNIQSSQNGRVADMTLSASGDQIYVLSWTTIFPYLAEGACSLFTVDAFFPPTA